MPLVGGGREREKRKKKRGDTSVERHQTIDPNLRKKKKREKKKKKGIDVGHQSHQCFDQPQDREKKVWVPRRRKEGKEKKRTPGRATVSTKAARTVPFRGRREKKKGEKKKKEKPTPPLNRNPGNSPPRLCDGKKEKKGGGGGAPCARAHERFAVLLPVGYDLVQRKRRGRPSAWVS